MNLIDDVKNKATAAMAGGGSLWSPAVPGPVLERRFDGLSGA